MLFFSHSDERAKWIPGFIAGETGDGPGMTKMLLPCVVAQELHPWSIFPFGVHASPPSAREMRYSASRKRASLDQ
ncbi:MAG TPA: hypothetical protein VGK80_08180 [Rhodanobacteraceae bacterium]